MKMICPCCQQAFKPRIWPEELVCTHCNSNLSVQYPLAEKKRSIIERISSGAGLFVFICNLHHISKFSVIVLSFVIYLLYMLIAMAIARSLQIRAIEKLQNGKELTAEAAQTTEHAQVSEDAPD